MFLHVAIVYTLHSRGGMKHGTPLELYHWHVTFPRLVLNAIYLEREECFKKKKIQTLNGNFVKAHQLWSLFQAILQFLKRNRVNLPVMHQQSAGDGCQPPGF